MNLLNTDLIIKYTDNELSRAEELTFEKNMQKDKVIQQELVLHKHLNSFMKSRFQIDYEIENEQFNDEVDDFAKDAISDYLCDEKDFKDVSLFLSESNIMENQEEEIIMDHQKNEIDIVTSNWVDEWKNELENASAEKQKYFNEISSFVAQGMSLDQNENQKHGDLEIIKDKSETRKVQALFSKWYYTVAAAAAILLLSFGLWQIIDQPIDNNELFANYYQPYPLVSDQTRSAENQQAGLYEEASNYYKDKNFGEAAIVFKKSLEREIDQTDIRFLYAISLVEIKEYNEAIAEFKEIISSHHSYNLESRWYLSLCYLKLASFEDARKLLIEISEERSIYQKSALEILDLMN